MTPRQFIRRFKSPSIGKDSVAGVVLGAQSVPDSLASGLIAGVNPAFGLYGTIFGMVGGAIFTSSAAMTVQITGAMAAVISDVDPVHSGANADRALFTLTMFVGVVMLIAGALKLGSVLRFVSNAVLVGFVSGVGVNIVVGQLADLTGFAASGATRVEQLLDFLLHIADISLPTTLVGVGTIVLIVLMRRTRLGELGLIVAVIVTSALVAVFDLDVATLRDVAAIPTGLPRPALPDLSLLPVLAIPAVSLAFVGMVQGAAISANYPDADGSPSNASGDFVGQGAGNILAGVMNGMPVGGSMSATSILVAAGGASRLAQLIAGAVMTAATLLLGRFVDNAAMPALAGLLVVVGVETIDRDSVVAVWKVGRVQQATMASTFFLTLVIPLQYAVLVGVGTSVVLYVVRESADVTIRQLSINGFEIIESAPPKSVPPGEVIVLQPYGSLFFASSQLIDDLLPDVDANTDRSVVIVRFRGRTDLGTTLLDTFSRYATALADADSKLMVTTDSPRVVRQLEVTGFKDLIGSDNVYEADNHVGVAVRSAQSDAQQWIDDQASRTDASSGEDPKGPDST